MSELPTHCTAGRVPNLPHANAGLLFITSAQVRQLTHSFHSLSRSLFFLSLSQSFHIPLSPCLSQGSEPLHISFSVHLVGFSPSALPRPDVNSVSMCARLCSLSVFRTRTAGAGLSAVRNKKRKEIKKKKKLNGRKKRKIKRETEREKDKGNGIW